MHHLSSASPDFRGSNILQRCYDTGAGLFKGMVAATVERVSPHMASLEEKYQAHGRVVNSALVGAAAGGLFYAPWWTLAVAALTVPSVYVGYRLNAEHKTGGIEIDHPVNNAVVAPGLPITNIRLLPYPVAEETEILLARLVPVFISVLQVALDLRDTARDKAASSVKVITALETRANGEQSTRHKQQHSAMKQLLTDKHFLTLAANQKVSGHRRVAGKVADYNRLAELFLWVAECGAVDHTLSGSGEFSVWLLNEIVKTWITLSPEEFNCRLNALLAEDRADVIRQFIIDVKEFSSTATAAPRSAGQGATAASPSLG